METPLYGEDKRPEKHAEQTQPEVDSLPPFHAWPIPCLEDSTVFLHRDGVALNDCPVPEETRRKEFEAMQNFLLCSESRLLPAAAEGKHIGLAMPSLLSASGEAHVLRPTKNEIHTARAFACFADRRNSISITLRSLNCSRIEEDLKKDDYQPPMWFDSQGWLKSNFKPSNDRGERFWFSVEDQCTVLSERIFLGSTTQGLVVLTGARANASNPRRILRRRLALVHGGTDNA